MKYLLITSWILLTSIITYGQDPKITSPAVDPSPGLVNGPINVSVGFENNSTTAIPYDVNNPTMITFTLTKITPTLDANSVPSVTGLGAQYFDWIAVLEANGMWTVTGIQNKIIPGQADPFSVVGGPVVISGTINAASTPAEAAANNGSGFIANVNPAAGSDIDNTAGSNTQTQYGSTNGVLPVKLISFNAAKEGSSTNLTWATTEESNSDYFEIQHSLNAKNWAALGTVKSHGESTVLRNYTYQHAMPMNGTNYYRLRMVDKDQTYAYSTIRSATFEGLAESAVSVFPNPASDRLFVNNAEINKLKTLTIVGQDGKELITSPVSVSGVSIKSLQPGLYLVKLLSADGALSTHKLIISK